MSATYNWAYKPGVTNKYGIIIPSGADNARPTGFVYIALFGSDISGNGSRQFPYRTMLKAFTTYGNSDQTFIFGSGVYREDLSSISNKFPSNILVGDGDVKIDYSYYGWMAGQSGGGAVSNIYNITLIGSGLPISFTAGTANADCQDAYFNNTVFGNRNSAVSGNFVNCVFDNYPADYSGGNFTNCTFYNMSNMILDTNTKITSCIFRRCNISVTGILPPQYPRYSLFFECNFRFNSTKGTAGPTYPSTPTGFTYYSDYATMTAAYLAAFPTGNVPFPGCIIADPKFNNAGIGDYTLAFDSPAKNLSYFGTFVGARSIGQAIKARASESDGNFDFATAVNLTVADDSITLTDPSIDAQIDSKVIVNTLGREISKLPLLGFNADRNGQYIDSIADLDTVTLAAGDTLAVVASYLVEGGAITYNSGTYQPGDRFTTVSGHTTFTTSSGGVVREILEAPERHTIMARFSDGGDTITAGDDLVEGNYYFVQSGSVTYNGDTYNAGDIFKAIDTSGFSGSGTVIVALADEDFQHYEPGINPTSNNTGDSRTGAIVRGNGDPAYVRGGLGVKEFPINSKFIQIRYYIRVSNLKP